MQQPLCKSEENAVQRLREYSEFIGCIKENMKNGMGIREAVSRATDTCEEKGILRDLLTRCRTEVLDMLLAEYDEKKTMEYIRREARESGREEGERIGREKGEQRGRIEGKRIGEKLLSELLGRLFADDRLEDVRLAVDSETERTRLYREYRLLEEG